MLLGGYTTVCLWVPAGVTRTSTANILLCLMPLFVNGALLINAVTPDWRKRTFWMLLALGSSLWLAGQATWTYIEIYHHQRMPYVFNGYHFNVDVIFYLNAIPMIAALVVQPHKRPDDRKIMYGYVDFGLILCWWLYLYVFAVIPWQYVAADSRHYVQTFSVISFLQNMVFVGGAAYLFTRATGYWRRIYAHLAAARALYVIRLLAIQLVAGRGSYSRGSLYDLPLLISFLWLGTAGILAYQNREKDAHLPVQLPAEPSAESNSADETPWASRLARMALLSLPVIGFWCVKLSQAPVAVREFRLVVTLGAVLPLGFLTFLRHELVDRERVRLL